MKTDADFTELAVQITECSKNASKLLQDKNFEDAKNNFEEAYRISKLIRDPFTARKCAFNLGAVYIRLEQAAKGIEYLELAVPPENSEDKLHDNGDLYFNLALGYEMLQDHQNAVNQFKKSLKEYRYYNDQSDNRMVVECLEKLARNSRYLKNYLESSEWNGELCQIYASRGLEEKRLVTMGEQIVQLRKANEKEKCLVICDQIVGRLDQIIISPLTANMLNDVGLVLCQYQKLDEAERCYSKCVSMVAVLTSCDKLSAIILQNLGALYNITANYQKSVEYNSQAAAKFVQLQNGINEGHCYANLGYAYNQMGSMDKAREYFVLALRKAKDNGDVHAEWQVSESLGALCCNLGSLDVAIKYYTDAFKTITKDKLSNTVPAEDRIQAKLFTLMKQQAEKQQQNNNNNILKDQEIQILKQQQQQLNMQLQQQQNTVELRQHNTVQLRQHNQDQMQIAQTTQQHAVVNNQQPSVMIHLPSDDDESEKHQGHQYSASYNQQLPLNQSSNMAALQNDKENLIEPSRDLQVTHSAPELNNLSASSDTLAQIKQNTRKELIKRRLKVRRSGSLKEFDKVARGVYVSMNEDVLDTLQEDQRSVHFSDFSFTSIDTMSSSDSTISTASNSNNEKTSRRKQSKKSIYKMIRSKAEEKLKMFENKFKKADSSPEPIRRTVSRLKRSSDNQGLLNESLLQMEEEKQQVRDMMKQQLDMMESDNETSGTPKTDNKLKKKPSLSSSSSTSIGTDSPITSVSSSSDGSHTESSDEKSRPPKQRPSLPVQSPPQTLVNTYEKPEEPHYTEIEFEGQSSSVTKGEKGEITTVTEPHYTEVEFDKGRESENLGPNYFYDDNIQNAMNSRNQGLASTSLSDTIYETIGQPSDTADQLPSNLTSPTKSDLVQMSRAESNEVLYESEEGDQLDEVTDTKVEERYLFDQHLKSQPAEVPVIEDKKSKVCRIM